MAAIYFWVHFLSGHSALNGKYDINRDLFLILMMTVWEYMKKNIVQKKVQIGCQKICIYS